MSFELFIEKQVIKYLSKLDKTTTFRIFSKIESLKENPYPLDAKRIVNLEEKVYRIRIGKYRVLYRIENYKLVVVFLVDKRSRVYKK